VDFDFDHGLFHMVVANISNVPAYRVTVSFDKKFHGLGGKCDLSCLRMFRRIEFLAPQKRIETLLDTSGAYFQRREPTRITATISYRDGQQYAYERSITHDLSIYKDVAYVLKPAGRIRRRLLRRVQPGTRQPENKTMAVLRERPYSISISWLISAPATPMESRRASRRSSCRMSGWT
jgi:hypothetical protein